MPSLIYDYSNKKHIKKIKIKNKLAFLTIYMIIFGASMFLLFIPHIDISIRYSSIFMNIFFIFVGIFFLSIGFYGLIKSSGITDVKVYSSGISPPWKPIKNIIKREEYIIPFSVIKAVYPNTHEDIDYITIEFKDSYDINYLRIYKKWIYDLDEFLDILSEKLDIKEGCLYPEDMVQYYISGKR